MGVFGGIMIPGYSSVDLVRTLWNRNRTGVIEKYYNQHRCDVLIPNECVLIITGGFHNFAQVFL